MKPEKTVLLVGSPNVGKSAVFNALTGHYATVSNYPGTTVEVFRGMTKIASENWQIVDTPGMYSLFPVTEEERVTRRLLLREAPDAVVHVTDAKNLERMLPLTLQLLDAGLPLILVLNMMDEAEREGITLNIARLENELGIPVVPMVATRKEGLAELERVIRHYRKPRRTRAPVTFSSALESIVQGIAQHVPVEYAAHISRRMIALLLLSGDEEIGQDVGKVPEYQHEKVATLLTSASRSFSSPTSYLVAVQYRAEARQIAGEVSAFRDQRPGFKERLSALMTNPLTGFPILVAVLYFGLYRFVGGFGAGVVVDFLEEAVFEKYLSPLFTKFCQRLIPWPVLTDLVVGEYGILTLGLRYAVAIILPIVAFFFLVFAIVEDTGYLPRLAMLTDRIFKRFGLSGRAVIPMVLGLGCDTMATMVTRTLPTRRERVISTLLLSLAVPCSAQLGVILALMEGRPLVFMVWSGIVGLLLVAVGWLSNQVLPGSAPLFYMEIPPLRLPSISNVLLKTFARVKWYLTEIIPLFVLASVLIWLGRLTLLFDLLLRVLQWPVRWMGLPPESAGIFLFGFFRRDYGAAGLYDLNKQDLLTNNQIAVASVVLTLFLPCVAQLLINFRERGWKVGVAIAGTTLVIALGTGWLLNMALQGLGVVL